MGLLRTSSGAGQALRGLQGSRMRGSGLFVFSPSGQVTLESRREPLQRPPTGLSALRAPSDPPLGASPSRAVTQPTRISDRGLASPTRGRAPARILQPSSSAPKPEVRAGDPGAGGACAREAPATHAEHRLEPASGPRRARLTSGTRRADPFPASRQLSSAVVSAGTVRRNCLSRGPVRV